ncbi:toxin-antitoxin system antitoxin subunit [Aerococcaceae bacterium zg-ZUI334]|uniref:type II toxin-antitoxin system RelB/ParD family antitoxin n=1 Tax=Aerococcaceae bacterium zg-252 TaxID=2796928 RepID=UPI001B9BEE4F|nr:toxin-antitoxin system antitoxin subunit [Aerococcaceae bacterium zg-ZUI334]
MDSIVKDRQINFKVNAENFELAKKVFKDKGLDVTAAFNQFIQEVAITNDLPFKTIEEQEREQLIAQLQQEVTDSYNALRAGQGLSLEEARKAVFS